MKYVPIGHNYEIKQYKKPVLGLFGGDKKKIKELEQKIRRYEAGIKGLTNNLNIPNTPFTLGEFYIDYATNREYFCDFQTIEYDDNRCLYIVYDENVGEIGSLKPEFTKMYGIFRRLKGSELSKEFGNFDPYDSGDFSFRPDDYTYSERSGKYIDYIRYYINVYEV
ncbi:hypothetical protein DES36_105159 [Alkalibaculum bacchi]|uniref:Uncharacterized protein n=1 Tax=Alkalibaculum bacchi TaxID=645887 RepID=A0A366ICG7_9FIRM|nr:hypothetical protein [Alkalibaculum bacchi]RBP66774.1 hypothetical protein DES36_105159 [Alkalibaculum bacchi]